jgi:hypothetical protein
LRILALVLVFSFSGILFAAKKCYTPADAMAHPNKDVCVTAHVYDVVELADGTRFLDVCSPETPDEQCRFTILSANEDRKTVGDLNQYREQEIQIRGVVRPFGGRAEILLSDERQFHGGSEKFRPNPALLHGFSAEDGKTAFSDPAMKSGRHRSVFKTGH